jgi:hypothetical protein
MSLPVRIRLRPQKFFEEIVHSKQKSFFLKKKEEGLSGKAYAPDAGLKSPIVPSVL